MKCYFSDIAFVYQTSDIRRGKSNRSRPWLTTHRNRLRGVDSEESEWGTSTAFPLQDFHRPTEDVSLDFHRCGIYFRSLARPTRKILFFTPELGSLNVIWRCRISGAVFGEVGVGGVVVVSPPLSLGTCGSGGRQLAAITSLSAPSYSALSPSYSLLFFPFRNQHLASCCL